MPSDLTVGERVVVRNALDFAIKLCSAVQNASDARLREVVSQYINLRGVPASLKQDYARIADALRTTKTMLFEQGQNNIQRENGVGWFAEVDPDTPYSMTLGDAFFEAPRKGFNSCAGTMIHEASHWNVVRGTDDHAYGEDVENLAVVFARNNADTLEYIAEALAR